MPKTVILWSVFLTSFLGILFPSLLFFVAFISSMLLGYTLWQEKNRGFTPQSHSYKMIEKIKKKREKSDLKKHHYISDQIAYIEEVWGYTQEQHKILHRCLDSRAYLESYNRLSASLLPQIISLIDHCNAQEQRGCKREVSRRLRELTHFIKVELEKKQGEKQEHFETTLEVYDRLLSQKSKIN